MPIKLLNVINSKQTVILFEITVLPVLQSCLDSCNK